MRDIRFRVWSIGREKWLNECMFDMQIQGAYDFSSDASMRYNYKTDVIVEQFTGFQDIKGIDIYDGDLIEKDDDKFVRCGVVSFIHGCWMVASKSGEQYFNLHWYLSQAKVIGNIHTHAELLNGDNDG